jgi:class 3 adenylate cyclase/tetratricopeptide (TPR) repeat protein
MRCSKCGFENPSGMKFCGQCTAALALVCPKCRFENPPGFKFCGQCTTALTSATAGQASTKPPVTVREADDAAVLEGERKTVTALFADIKGSTELEQDLDPEEARSIVDPALRLMIDAARRYDGYVVQSTGDGIFALFGAPVAHEDHPQRALHAALRMQEELRRYSDKLLADGRAPLEIRVGVNTGEVVVRSISTGGGNVEYTPIGHTTNLASRMQAVAPTGSIAITERTRRLVEGYFALKPRGPTRVKGVSEAVNVYEVTGLGPLRTRLQRSAGRGLTKFVGREREMEALKRAAEQAKAGRGQIVAAMAEAGVGKSRLFYEFKVTSQSGCMVLETFSVSHGKASAYLPIIDLLHGYFKITGDDDARTRREKVTGRVVALDRALEDALPYLFALLGIVEGDDPLAQMDGQVKKRRTLEAIKRILLRESLNQPLMVIFEDLHWIDEQTQEFLNLMADSMGTAKILLLVNYRPEYSHQWGSKTYYTQLRLDPLGRESAGEMLTALLGDGAELGALKGLIIEKTEGTPFFMEETVQVLLDEGALVRNGAAVKLTRPLAELKIPPTVQAILAARIDRLPQDAKELLQTLSVIGREFPLSLIRAVIPKSDDELDRVLNDLQLGEFIYEQPSVGDTGYIFKHALTQEVAYNSVLMERRKQLHERIGAALETLYASSLDDHLAELAHHYGRADDPAKAVDYLRRAGEQSSARSAFQEATNRLTSALELVNKLASGPGRDASELAVRLALIEPMMAAGFLASDDLRLNLERARALCGATGDGIGSSPVLNALATAYWSVGDLRTAGQVAREMLEMAQRDTDELSLCRANNAVGFVDAWMGRLSSARDSLERAVNVRQDLVVLTGDYFWLANSLAHLAWMLWMLGYPDQAVRQMTHLRDLLKRPIDLANRAGIFQCVLATSCHFLRDYRGMREQAESLIALAQDSGMPYWLGCGLVRLGRIEVEAGDFTIGIEKMLDGMRTFRSVGESTAYEYFCCVLAEAYLMAGRVEEGLTVLDEALKRSNAHDQRFCEPEMHRLKGELLLLARSTDEAETALHEAIAVARGQEARSWELRATTSLAQLLSKQGRGDEARTMLAEIYGWFTEGFDTADLKEAKALLDELAG